MLTLLSPAKKLNMDAYQGGVEITQPRLLDDMQELGKVAKRQSQGDLKRLMHLSDNLAKLNADRFTDFDLENQAEGMKPAGLAFDGDVYWGFEAKTLSDSDLEYAQGHVRILSGLYGILRPMDLIQPYRLEMGTKLKNKRGETLYDFWGTELAEMLNDDLNGHHDHTIVNLASNEYFKAVDKKTLDKRVIEIKFLEEKDGKSRPIQYYTKFGRGLFARWIVQNRINHADDLKNFADQNYKFVPERSDEDLLVFERPQPPKKS